MSNVDDAEAYSWFFRGEYPAVVRAAYLVAGDRGAAEDAAQEAFIQLLRHWRKVSHYEQPDAWVRRVALRIAMRRAKRDRKRVEIEQSRDRPETTPSTDLDLMDEVRALPPQQRAAVVLFYYEDRPVAELATILGCSESTAKVHLHKARKSLGLRLGEEAADVP
jgi:RNA polymerase sigma-70 factor, ECF subfamily